MTSAPGAEPAVERPAAGEWPAAAGPAELARWRADFPALERFTWLQNGGVSLVPRPVHEAHVRLLAEALERGPLHIAWPEEEVPRRAASRARIARFLGVEPAQVAITRGVTEALGLVLRSIDWAPGDELVITADEEAAIAVPALHLRDERGVRIRRIPLPADSRPAAVGEAAIALLGPRTRLVAISHVTTDLGVRLPAALITAAAETRGIPVFLDAAHSAGTVPLDLAALGASYAGVVSYKWMMAPYAAGALVVRPDRIATTPIRWAGGRSERVLDHAGERLELYEDARRFEAGPWSWPLVHAWAAAIDHLEAVGVERVAARAAGLTGRLIDGLDAVDRVTVHTPRDPAARAALVAFGVRGWPGPDLERHLRAAHRIVVRALTNDRDGIRASCAYFTSEAEVDALVDAVRSLPESPTRRDA
jgi:selenocysteine lyase/cysteine desulfurase